MLTGELFRLADRQAQWLDVRQRVIAENIAHSNTPNHIAKSVSEFSEKSSGFRISLSQTNGLHLLPKSNSGNGGNFKISEDPSGKPVQIENEMFSAIDVRRSYELNTSIVKAFNRMILSAAKG